MAAKYTYYEVWASRDVAGQRLVGDERPKWEPELMAGSYDRSDCVAEIEVESEGWYDEGMGKIHIQSRETEKAPDPEVYGAANCARWAH